MIKKLHFSITETSNGLAVNQVDETTYSKVAKQRGYVPRVIQLPKHDCHYAAPATVHRAKVKQALAGKLNIMLQSGEL